MTAATESSIKNWFDQLYSTKQHRSMRPPAAYPVFLEHLQVSEGKMLLDIGCGPGWLLKAAAERGVKTCGIDLSPAAIKLAGLASPTSTLKVASVNQIPFPENSFDYLTCIGVFEHFLDVRKAVREMQRVAKPDARFCIMVPNSRTLYWKMSKLFSRSHGESNENAFLLKEWIDILRVNGFTIQKVYRDEWQIRKTLGLLGFGWSEFLFKTVRKMVETIIPLKFAHQFIFILGKR